MRFSETEPSGQRWNVEAVNPIFPAPEDATGVVYFIACKETERCKIGFTKGDPLKRLRNLQTGAAGELRLLAAQPGNPAIEKALHERFAAHSVHGEWFEMSEELFAYMCAIVWVMSCLYASANQELEQWMKVGLRMLNDGMAEVPSELMALTE
jgi:hypothetical protein